MFLDEHVAGKKKPFMARFYEAQRKRMNVLMASDGTPLGGQWSFDAENRARLPKNHVPPPSGLPPSASNKENGASLEHTVAEPSVPAFGMGNSVTVTVADATAHGGPVLTE